MVLRAISIDTADHGPHLTTSPLPSNSVGEFLSVSRGTSRVDSDNEIALRGEQCGVPPFHKIQRVIEPRRDQAYRVDQASLQAPAP